MKCRRCCSCRGIAERNQGRGLSSGGCRGAAPAVPLSLSPSLGQVGCKAQGERVCPDCTPLLSHPQQLFNCRYTQQNLSGAAPATQPCKAQVPNIYNILLFLIITFDPKPMKFLPAQTHCLSKPCNLTLA